MNCKPFIFSFRVLLLSVFGITILTAQPSLKQISRQRELQWQTNRAIAESIAARHGVPLRVERDGGIIELQRYEHGIPRMYVTDNLNSAKTTSTNKLWPGAGYGFSLTGSSDTLGEWDAGAPLTTHQEFGSRIISSQGSAVGHSTHVAGTLIATGLQAPAQGMSYQAKLKAFDWDNDVSEMAAAAAGGLRVSNHSYGLITGWYYNLLNDNRWAWFGDTTISGTQDYRFGLYDSEANAWDQVAFNAPYYLIVKAAGNDRGEGPPSQPVQHWIFDGTGNLVLSNTVRPLDGGTTGYNTLNGGSLAKNVLSVGAVSDILNGYQQPSDVVMSSFSCWGPTADGRIKPDIVADGINVFSTYSTSPTSYATASGTSMATPNVVGSVGLLLQYQKNLHGDTPLLASTLRGILIQTADDAGNPGPDYSFGWGLLNTYHAASLLQQDSADGPGSHIHELLIDIGDTIRVTLYSDGVTPLKATLCWTDPEHDPLPPALNPPTITLVNDLDLRLIQQSNQAASMPWILDPSHPSNPATVGDNTRDNVEQVMVTSPNPGIYTARITYKGILSATPQTFSLITSGNVPYYKPIVSAVSPGGGYPINPGAVLAESLKVYNAGNRDLDFTLSAGKTWLIPDTGTTIISARDSGYAHFTLNAVGLSQWTTLSDTLAILSNDTALPAYRVPLVLSLKGPKILAPASLSLKTDSGLISPAVFKIHDIGTLPLAYIVTDNDSVPPSWLSTSGDSGMVGVGDSVGVTIMLDATHLNTGAYNASLKIVSNDSSTGTLIVPLNLTVMNGLTVLTGISNNWNMLSLPVQPSNKAKSFLYPTATSPGFGYNGSYIIVDSLHPGTGYWMKFNGNQNVSIDGLRIVVDTVQVWAGWNLIGSNSFPVYVGSIGSDPPGMITSNFFGYSGAYVKTDSILPGRGYWVKVGSSGSLILSSNTFSTIPSRIVISPIEEPPPSPPQGSDAQSRIPKEFNLGQAYPNPFNPTTVIPYDLPTESRVSLTVYNVMGQGVAVLRDGVESAGFKSVQWNALNVASGLYFYRIQATSMVRSSDSYTEVRKLILLK